MIAFELSGDALAIKSVNYFRKLRINELTARQSADVIIATYYMKNRMPLLFLDNVFIPVVENMKPDSVC